MMSLVPGEHVIEPARRKDAIAIAFMSRELVESGLTWRWRPPAILEQIRRRDTEVVVARSVGGDLVGFAIMRFSDEDAHLILLAVKPTYRRQHFATSMIRWLEDSARCAGVFRVHLEVRAKDQVARSFYRSLGYREIRMLPGYYEGREAAVRVLGDLRVKVQG